MTEKRTDHVECCEQSGENSNSPTITIGLDQMETVKKQVGGVLDEVATKPQEGQEKEQITIWFARVLPEESPLEDGTPFVGITMEKVDLDSEVAKAYLAYKEAEREWSNWQETLNTVDERGNKLRSYARTNYETDLCRARVENAKIKFLKAFNASNLGEKYKGDKITKPIKN
ncbi:hypothetical protein C0416_02080 [bacterium]|nr:hypothetical protein [bacterium]